MWWKKKKVAAVAGGAGGAEVMPPAVDGEATPKLEVVRHKVEKLPGPKRLPRMIETFLSDTYNMDPEIVKTLKMVMKHRPEKENASDCRIFDPEEAEALNLKVTDYNFLNDHTDMILYDGWIDEGSKRVELSEKRKMDYDVPILTLQEIHQKIEALRDPGSTVFFYQARGPVAGGPLGRGAAIVELNPAPAKKKGKKYGVYTSNMFKAELVGERSKLWSSDKPMEIAKWIKNAHHKRARLSESEA